MADKQAHAVEVIRAHALAGLPHGFLTRRGGVSTGDLAGLNCGPGSGDDLEAVVRNRAQAVAAVHPGAKLVTGYQVHSATCLTVQEPWSDDARPQADALVTDRPGLLLGILTADCAPVLLADRLAGVVGAAHAGWRGALAGVTDRTIEAMEALGAARHRIVAAIGPCIAQPSYEVDALFLQRFEQADQANGRYFAAGAPEHFQFDLEAYVEMRIRAAQILEVERLGLDTYAAPGRFFSYRRAAHCGKSSYGRQISVIAIE
ncbi:MAG: peptidoglycan editing factor PgeF [Sphingomonadaceae bacterium]|nr:peptidoglycan editing factor PgeF [Sphingomonadaceae bacterium]